MIPHLDPTFILGIFVLLYLSSFLLLAVLRIVTGLSIQRFGYFSVRRLAYTPRDGVRIELRGLGLNLHRPTFAQPTWLSLVLTELAVTVDLKALAAHQEPGAGAAADDHGDGLLQPRLPKRQSSQHARNPSQRGKTWEHLNLLKERIKRVHRRIHWLRMVDLVATNSTLTVTDVGTLQMGSFTLAVDTRRKMVDRRRFFVHRRNDFHENRPAEWIMTPRSVLFTADGRDSLEVLDHATLNVHGLLYKNLDGLRDAAISLKLGRVHIPVDDFDVCLAKYNKGRSLHPPKQRHAKSELSVLTIMEEIEQPGSSREEHIVQTVSDSKEFASSILRGIKEIQFAVSYVGLSQQIHVDRPAETPIFLNASMKEVGIDVHRLDPNSPAHRMYFSSKDIAHEALVAALSIAVGVDDGHGKPERLIYIPMATMTMRTTLPSKSVEFVSEKSADERNANMLFANVVVTSPSIDLDPKHLPLVLSFMQPKPRKQPRSTAGSHSLISRLLPKANVKLSMHEPVVRITLPPVEESAAPEDFDLIISSITSVALDMESSHSAAEQFHYGITSTFRVQSHELYYQTSSNKRYDLLQTGTFELKLSVSANPDVFVVASINLQTVSVHMIRPEISDGVRQIVRNLRSGSSKWRKPSPSVRPTSNFLRAVPPWLVHVQLQGSDFNAEIAGIDSKISTESRGLAIQLESWSSEYRAQRLDPAEKKSLKRRASRAVTPDAAELLKTMSPEPKKSGHRTDGRRLTIHSRGLEVFVIESADKWDPESFVSIPRLEVAFSTATDKHGPILHVNSFVKSILIQYSLYRHYAIGVAISVLQHAFLQTKQDKEAAAKEAETSPPFIISEHLSPVASPDALHGLEMLDVALLQEIVTVDVKVSFLQMKANMPSDPPMMLQVQGIEGGQHRWSAPFLQMKLGRLYVEAPKLKHVWVRLVSTKNLRTDLRVRKRKTHGAAAVQDNFIDINSDAIRMSVPHQVVLYKVFDNIVNTLKASEQLAHRFRTGTDEYILDKKPIAPKQVPKISLRSKVFSFIIDDSAFEWKLGNIYRTGLVEQQQRLAREQAFKVKVRRIEDEEHRDSTRGRGRSAHHRGAKQDPLRHNSDKSPKPKEPGKHGRQFRYDPEGICGLSAKARITISEAHERLNRHNSQSWKRRIDACYKAQRESMKEIRSTVWGGTSMHEDMEESENILELPNRPGLMATNISDLHVIINKPSFPLSELPAYLHRVGKGMPLDMQYTMLIPMHVQIDMGEVRMTLRDYPLPLLHVPAIRRGQSRHATWSMKTDFVIAEEYRDRESTRKVNVNIVPPQYADDGTLKSNGFAIDVVRTVAPVKSYSEINVSINTPHPTRITWGPSYQPAIQDMMMIVETFTKPQIDPSERTGFWDKIRLSFHSRINVSWNGDGDVHLVLKGSRDPYVVTGNGAGLLMCWRNDVKWCLHPDNEPRRFMTVESGEYVLAVPDFSNQARSLMRVGQDDDSIHSASSDTYRHGTVFKKVVMKLSGKVQWMAGLVFERNAGNGKRSFDFKPHYDVILKNPEYAIAPPGEVYDAFKGFRSQYIHLSIAVKAPVDRDWSVSNTNPSRSYNTVHLTPRFFTHFFAWWQNFGGNLNLPIRQGRLWPGPEKSSKKFGRHLATIKYSLLLAPLFLSHVYKHKDVDDNEKEGVSATGIKGRLDSFMLDVHQRREEFRTCEKNKKMQTRTSGMKMHRAQLELVSADVRAISATMADPTPEDLRQVSAPALVAQDDIPITDVSNFTIHDNDYTWIDMDDFVELDWILPSLSNPETVIMPLGYAPRFTYIRNTDHGDVIDHDPERTSPFGNEKTHFCTMNESDDTRRVQYQLVQDRLERLYHHISEHKRVLGEAELRFVQDDGKTPSLKQEVEKLACHEEALRTKRAFLETMSHRLSIEMDTASDIDTERPPSSFGIKIDDTRKDLSDDFNNRFVIHNMQLKWNNTLRNILLRYIHQVSQRRGFVYYLSRRAVKFILDIVEEQNKAKASKSDSSKSTPPNKDPESQQVDEIIKGLLADGKDEVCATDPAERVSISQMSSEELKSNIGEDFAPQNSYHLRIIAPQIQLQSEKNEKAVVLVTAKGMELKVVEIMDKDRLFDDVSGLVQRRFSVEMDGTQFFVTQQKWFTSQLLSLYSGSRYGTPEGSLWPPWVPLEVMFDFQTDAFGFRRVVQKTSASLRYDKYNTLRLKYNDEVSADRHKASRSDLESRMDHLWVEFPQVRAICDSAQYYAMYIIVMDLLLYSEPLEKVRNERLEKILLASDFSDLRGAPQMVVRLQERVRQLEEIKTQFQIHSRYLDQQGWEDRLRLEQDLANCEDELFFMMKAITTSQRKYDGSESSGLLRWNISSEQIVWHLMRGPGQPLMEFQLQRAEYDRTDNSDGSHLNLVQVEKIVGLNLLPDAIYPEIISPYLENVRDAREVENQKMIRVYWHMLEAIAGIPVMDHFEVNLFPLRIQLEREVGKKLFEYVFPGTEDSPNGGVPGKVIPEEDDETHIGTPRGRRSLADVDRPESNPSHASSMLELRLRPTMTSEAAAVVSHKKSKPASLHPGAGEVHHFRLFQGNKRSPSTGPSFRGLSKKASSESLRSSHTGRPGIPRSTTMTSLDGANANGEGKKRFSFGKGGKGQDQRPDDDLTKMMTRASNFMTLAYVTIPSVTLCLSYKGKGERNIEDLHDFVFRMPTLEYRNKTWSNLDLALALKKDFIRALISHTGAIIGNKFKHRPNTAQQSRLRELATSSTLLTPSSQESSYENSDAESGIGISPVDARTSEDVQSPRRSFTSSNLALTRSGSASSSVQSFRPGSRAQTLPLRMTAMAEGRTSPHDQSSSGDNKQLSSGEVSSSNGLERSETRASRLTAVGRKLHSLRRDVDSPAASGEHVAEDADEPSRSKLKAVLHKKILGITEHGAGSKSHHGPHGARD